MLLSAAAILDRREALYFDLGPIPCLVSLPERKSYPSFFYVDWLNPELLGNGIEVLAKALSSLSLRFSSPCLFFVTPSELWALYPKKGCNHQ